jgi:transposase InsO family protein
LYLAGHKDICTGEIVGYAMADRITKKLVSQSLFRAVRPDKGLGLIHHSDRGSQYCANAYRKLLEQFGMKRDLPPSVVPIIIRASNCRFLFKPHKLSGCKIAQRAMRPFIIVIKPIIFDDVARMTYAHEPVQIQAFIPEFAVEAFHIGIINRLPGSDEMELYPVLIRPCIQGVAYELRAVVHYNPRRKPPNCRYLV